MAPRRAFFASSCVLLCAVLLCGFADVQETRRLFPAGKVREQSVGQMSEGAELAAVNFSKSHLAWAEKIAGKRTVFLDGKQVGLYDDTGWLRFSDDEQHLIFTGKRDSRWFVVLDGEQKSQAYGRLTSPILSPDGHSFAVGACNQKKCHLVVNGEEIGPDFENISYPRFSKDGSHSAYFGFRSKQWVLMLDGKEFGPPMDNYAQFYWFADGKRVAVAALLNKKWTWVIDGVPGAAFEVISDIAFSPEYKHYAYTGASADYHFSKAKTSASVVVDGKVTTTYDGEGFSGSWTGLFGSTTKLNPGLRSLSAAFHGLSDPSYTWDGALVYAVRRPDGNVAVQMGDMPGPAFQDIVSPIIFTSDTRHIAYVAKRGDEFVEVRDHKPGAAFPGKRVASFVGYIAMSKDGGHLAYEIVRGGNQFQAGNTTRALRRVVLDGKAGPEYDAFSIQSLEFSPDARHHFYAVRGAEGQRDLVVFDGMESKLYDDLFGGSVEFIDEQSIEFLARDGRRILRVTMALE